MHYITLGQRGEKASASSFFIREKPLIAFFFFHICLQCLGQGEKNCMN